MKQVLRYISHFGPGAGLQAARLLVRPAGEVRVRLPELVHPIWGRSGTADVQTFNEVFVAREYELPFGDFVPRHILDLGANVGYASVYFAARWPQTRILAVEPAPGNLALLGRNIEPWRRIGLLQAAVWGHSATVRIANPDDAANAYRMTEQAVASPVTVPAYTVAQLIELQGDTRVDLVKMDVEGAELEIFRGGTEWLDRVDVLMVELHDRIVPGCTEALAGALWGRHYRQEIVGSNLAFDFR